MLEPIHQDPEKFDEICAWCPLPPKLIGKKVCLTAIDPECTSEFLRFMTDEEVATGLGSPLYTAYTFEEEYGILSSMICDPAKKLDFMIWDINDTNVIGSCSLSDINLIHRTATLGINIGSRKHRGCGRGQDAVKTLIKFAFEELDLFEINLGVYEFNEGAIACYEKCGFKEYGRRRQSRYIHGKRYDEVLMDILREEYEASKGNVEE